MAALCQPPGTCYRLHQQLVHGHRRRHGLLHSAGPALPDPSLPGEAPAQLHAGLLAVASSLFFFYYDGCGLEIQLVGPKRPHKHKNPTNHVFQYPPCIGPWNQDVRSSCFPSYGKSYIGSGRAVAGFHKSSWRWPGIMPTLGS